MLVRKIRILIFIIAYGICGASSGATDKSKVAIASAHPLATDAGFEIIAQGGNVYDAAVAVSAALAVVEPASSGLGGGGYWLLHRTQDNLDVFIDGREKAPLAAHKNMFVDKTGKVIPNLSLDGALAPAIPGLPAGLAHLAEKYGQLPLVESLKPAIRYAKNGFAIGRRHLLLLGMRAEELRKNKTAAEVFLNKGTLPEPFSILKQPDLAHTLERLSDSGRNGFYKGETAARLVKGVRKLGGIWTQEDLSAYKIIERQPLQGNYRGIRLTTAPPSSSGGTVLIEALNMLAGFDLQPLDSAIQKHLIVETMRRAYHDRALYLGDSDFVDLPLKRLLNPDYAAGLSSTIRPDKSLPSAYFQGDPGDSAQGPQTTHFSIIDTDGNRVAATLSINTPYGSGIMPEDTGVILNNEMDDFASASGAMNGYGLVGGTANAIAPGKRMLSSMTPTFLETQDRIAVLGTPGGSRIISMVLLGVLDFAQGRPPLSWVSAPRYHHQYIPDVIEYEPAALSGEEIVKLKNLGHPLKVTKRSYGDMQAAQLNKTNKALSAASDPRGEGKAMVSQ